MGIVNVTPDSFSDGGLHLAAEDARAAVACMTAEGADIVDIGGESTRPGHVPLSVDEEWRRLAPVLEPLGTEAHLPWSIDTWKAEIAARALALGASIVNDTWGFQRDPDIAGIVADSGAGAILMHNRESVDPAADIVGEILRFLETSVRVAEKAGIPRDRIAVDPGIGFGKTYSQNYQAIAALPRLREFGCAILLGLSRKGFIGALTEPALPARERLPGTIAGNVYGLLAGADIIRVHDVAAHVQAARLLARIGEAA